MITQTFKIPDWSLCYLFNGDCEGLTDEEIAMCDDFMIGYKVVGISLINEDSETAENFGPFPAFGLACGVYDCEVLCDL